MFVGHCVCVGLAMFVCLRRCAFVRVLERVSACHSSGCVRAGVYGLFVCICVQDRFQDIEGGLEVLLLAPLALAVHVCVCARRGELGPRVLHARKHARVCVVPACVACACVRAWMHACVCARALTSR